MPPITINIFETAATKKEKVEAAYLDSIESQKDVSKVEPMLAKLIRSDTEASAFIIGCYSDPGLALCREITNRPVFGIAECAILTALTRGASFGVISILANSVARHTRHLRERLLHTHCVGDRPLGLTVAQTESGEETFSKMLKIGTTLRNEDGADVIILSICLPPSLKKNDF